MDIRIMGNVEIYVGDDRIYLPRRTTCAVLAILALNSGQWVPTGRLIDFVWSGNLPHAIPQTVRRIVVDVRRALERVGGDRTCISGDRNGARYMLSVGPEATDYGRYRLRATEARAASRAGHRDVAISEYRQALDIWRGPAFSDVRTSEADRTRSALDHERARLLTEMQNEQLHSGDFVAVADQLEQLLTSCPRLLTETLITQGVYALTCSDRNEIQIQKFIDRAIDVTGLSVSQDFLSFMYRIRTEERSVAQVLATGHYNGLFGTVNGSVVQAGVIHGDVHIHNNLS